jgi:dienelactone hydrolase
MNQRISIEARNGTFEAYCVRPVALPAPAVVVLQELFGVNADIREHCDELSEQGFIAVAPDAVVAVCPCGLRYPRISSMRLVASRGPS